MTPQKRDEDVHIPLNTFKILENRMSFKRHIVNHVLLILNISKIPKV